MSENIVLVLALHLHEALIYAIKHERYKSSKGLLRDSVSVLLYWHQIPDIIYDIIKVNLKLK